MPKTLAFFFAALLLAGCAVHRAPLRPAPPPGPYDGWYDGYYGPVAYGYWGRDGSFWYLDGKALHRDGGGHFSRRDQGGSFKPFHTAPPPAGTARG